MESQSSPYIEDGLLPAGSIDLGINSVAAEKTLCNSISSSGCERRLYKERPSYPPWIYLLGIAFTSLAAIYFLLRCYDFVRERPKVIGLARSLAAGGYRACLGNTNQDEEEEQAGKAGEFKGTFGQDNEATELDGDDPQVGPTEGQLREGEAGDVWGRRNLPPCAEKQFVALFERMVDAASLCRSLLPTLNESEGLRLTHEVIRVMALDLGALSLVRKHLEPFRLVLGNALVDLGSDALKRSRDVGELETCKAIRELMLVVGELKEPRPFTENPFNLKYKMKMTSILRTAEATGNYCMTVLKELLSATQQPRRLAPTDFERLLRVLKALYRVHSSHIAKDGALRFYIVMIQDKMGVRPLLGDHHRQMAATPIPRLQHMVDEISEAVRRSGGILLPSETDLTQHHFGLGSESPVAFWGPPQHEEPHGLPSPARQQRFTRRSLPSPASSGSTATPIPEALAYPAVSSHRQARLFGQPAHQLFASSTHSWGIDIEPRQMLPPSPSSLPVRSPSMPWVHASPQDTRDVRLYLREEHTSVGSAAAPSHLAATESFVPHQPQLAASSLGVQKLKGATTAHTAVEWLSNHRDHTRQAPALSIWAPVQDIQRVPATPPWRASTKGSTHSHADSKGFKGASATVSADVGLVEAQYSSSHSPATVSRSRPRQSKRDLAGGLASEHQRFGSSYGEYSLFGQSSQPPWLPTSSASVGQPLASAFVPVGDIRQGGAIQQGEGDEELMAKMLTEGLVLKDCSPGDPDHSARE